MIFCLRGSAKPPAEQSEANKVPSEASLIKYISTYTCNTIKKTAVKPPAERSEGNKVPSEVRLINYISTYTCNKTPTILWVSKFYVKLRIFNIFSKLTSVRAFLKNYAKII